MATAVQRDQFLRIGRQIMNRINSTASARAEVENAIQIGSQIMKLLPPSTLEWRLKEWLLLGSFLMNDRCLRLISMLFSIESSLLYIILHFILI